MARIKRRWLVLAWKLPLLSPLLLLAVISEIILIIGEIVSGVGVLGLFTAEKIFRYINERLPSSWERT
jgi:hypothetical protein